MLLLTEQGLIAARDFYGRTPVLIGKGERGYAVSSESNSFPNLGYEVDYTLGPGEIILITADGCKQLRKPENRMQVCSFLWVYYGYPASQYERINTDEVRRKLGLEMASIDNIGADYVSGIPDSGIGMALGYSEGRNIPYRRAIVKYTPTWPRSFTPVNQEDRELIAKMKLVPNRYFLRDKRIIFCDDSIVRGTQLRDNVNILYGYGAKEVHMRISCPPLVYVCPFINFSASKSELELITRRIIDELGGDLDAFTVYDSPEYNKMIDIIAKQLKITTLKFNSIEALVSAIGLPKCKLCTHCFDNSSYGQ